MFGDVLNRDGSQFTADIRGVLKKFANDQFAKNGYTLNAANEIEGFLFGGVDAEQRFYQTGEFEYVNTGGYYKSLPGDPLRSFIDTVAEVQRAMGFETKRTIPKSRRRSLRSTTATATSLQRPTGSQCIN